MQEKELSILLEDEFVKECIARNLQKNRKNRNMSRMAVGKSIGVNQHSIYRYETTQRVPNIQVLLQLANVYDTSLEKLIGYDEIAKYLAEKS